MNDDPVKVLARKVADEPHPFLQAAIDKTRAAIAAAIPDGRKFKARLRSLSFLKGQNDG